MTIFLDLDGVLNHGTAMSAFSDDSISEYAMNNLNNIIEHFGDNAEIVITSQWKDAFPAERVIRFLFEKGLRCNKIDITEINSKKDHGIRIFCEQNNVKDFFVLDDNFDAEQEQFFKNRVYKTNTHHGLTENDVLIIKRTFSHSTNNLVKYYFTPEELKHAFDSITNYEVEIKADREKEGSEDRVIDTIDPKHLIWFLFKTKYGVNLEI